MYEILQSKVRQRKERKEYNVELWWLSVNPKIKELNYVKEKNTATLF